MSFLAPLMWLGALLAVPVVLFYLVREEPRHRVVSTLLFWTTRQVRPHESPRWQKLRRPLSLLLQLLFLMLVVAALTKPVPPWEEKMGGSMVFVLDTSLSMAARDEEPDRFRKAVELIREEVRGMAGGDRATLLLTGVAPRVAVPWTRDRQAFFAALESARVSPLALDPGETLSLAANLAGQTDGEIRFFTDAVWDGSGLEDFAGNIFLVGSPAPNAGITLFAARRSLVAPEEVLLVARVGCTPGSKGPLRLQLLKDNELFDAREIPLQTEGEIWEKTWVVQEQEACTFEARLSGLEGDILVEDDSALVEVPELTPVEAMLVSPPDLFWESALKAIPRVTLERAWPPDFSLNGDPDKLWIFRGVVPATNFQSAGLVLMAPESGGFFGELLGDMAAPHITRVDGQADIMRFAALEQVNAGSATEFQPAPGARIYASSAGRPLLFGNWESENKWLVVAMDPSQSDLVLRSAFPVLLSNLIQGLRGDIFENTQAQAPNASVTSLQANHLAIPSDAIFTSSSGILARPLWWWLLAVAVAWLFIEWFTYHRRWTE